MKYKIVVLLGLVVVLSLLMAACSGTTLTPQTEEPKSAENVVAEQPAAPEEETLPEVSETLPPTPEIEPAETKPPAAAEGDESAGVVSVTFNSTIRSSDLAGYAWIQEFLSSGDIESADVKSLAESARAGAVCYASIAPSSKSAPSAADGSFSVTFEAEWGSTFRILCDADETHPGAMSIDVFEVPFLGGTIDHDSAEYLYSGLWSPELGIANDLSAKAAGYTSAEDMFQTAGTCRVLALPGESTQIAVSDGEAYGFYMEAPDTASRITTLADEAGAYIVIKEFGAEDSEAEIEIEFTDASGDGLAWPTATCPIKKGFSTHVEVSPMETAADFSLPDSNGNTVSLTEVLRENEQVALVFYVRHSCTPCMAQLTQIDNDLAKYEEKGAQVIAIAFQNQEGADISAKVSNVQFPILLADKAVAEAYGVLFESVSSPAVFLINKDRQIFWSKITHLNKYDGCGSERVPSETILDNLG